MSCKFNNDSRHHVQCPPHLHTSLEVILLCEGDSFGYIDTEEYEMNPGDMFISFPHQIHYYKSYKKEAYYLLIFKPEMVPEYQSFFMEMMPKAPIIKNIVQNPSIRPLFDLLCAAYKAPPSPYHENLVHGLLLSLFSYALPLMEFEEKSPADTDALRAVINYCTKHYAEDISLSSLEEELHLNRYYISHLFSDKIKIRFNDYINSLRIAKACQYLLSGNMNISEICDRVGFNTLRTFNRAFIKQMKMPPSEYRKRELGE